jgi:hypothetical protein
MEQTEKIDCEMMEYDPWRESSTANQCKDEVSTPPPTRTITTRMNGSEDSAAVARKINFSRLSRRTDLVLLEGKNSEVSCGVLVIVTPPVFGGVP